MALNIDFQSLIDIGLILLVTFACAKSLFRDNGTGEARRGAWKSELKELEASLRGLIQEAGAASRNFDRSLLARKRELESLLKELDEKGIPSTEATEAIPRSAAAPSQELPNSSWAETSPSPKAYTPAGTASSGSSVESPLRNAGLEQLIEKADDTLSLSQQVTKEVLRQQTNKRKQLGKGGLAASLAEKLAESNSENELDALEQATFEGTSIMDQATYKNVRRLLRSGKELHVVARKVELPVSEIRLLDRLIREEDKRRNGDDRDETDVAQPESPQKLVENTERLTKADVVLPGEGTFTAASPTTSKGISPAGQAAQFEAGFEIKLQNSLQAPEPLRNLDNDIEREIALL
jgi:hypothetical protein